MDVHGIHGITQPSLMTEDTVQYSSVLPLAISLCPQQKKYYGTVLSLAISLDPVTIITTYNAIYNF